MILFISAITTQILYTSVGWHHNRFTALFLGPPGWAGARRELLDFMVQGEINRDRHTDHPAGCHSIQTNQCPPSPHPPYFLWAGYPSYRLHNSVKALKAVVWWWWRVGWHLKVTASKHGEDVHACCLWNVAACRLTEIRSVLPCRFQVIFKILLTIYTRIQVEKFGTVLPPQNRGSTYMRVRVCQHTCHEVLHKADDVSWAHNWRTLRPVARRLAAMGHWHVTLVCITAADEWACGRGVQCVPCCVIAGRSPTWAWLAHYWHCKWRTVS